jgi:hypothetical protein
VNAQFLLKVLVTVTLVLAATALARRSGWLGALVASLPLTSVLVLGWLYFEIRDPSAVASLAMGIFWFVLGSLPFFLVLAFALRQGFAVGIAFGLAALSGFAGVSLVQWLMTRTTP